MGIHTWSVLKTGTAVLTASAIGFASAPDPPPSASPIPTASVLQPVRFTARVWSTDVTATKSVPIPGPAAAPPSAEQENLLSILLTEPLRLLGPAKPLGSITPPPTPGALSVGSNLADTIDAVYLNVEPWVRWGFQVATDVIAWIPWVGWFAGQTMVFYNFFEAMVQSGVFNFTDWLRGQGGVVENLVDFGVDVVWSFVYLGIDEWNYFLPPLPPLPFPIPPRPPLNQFAPELADTDLTTAADQQHLFGSTALDGQESAAAGIPDAAEGQAVPDVPPMPEIPFGEDGTADGAVAGEKTAAVDAAELEAGAVPEETVARQDGDPVEEATPGDGDDVLADQPVVEPSESEGATEEAGSGTDAGVAVDVHEDDTEPPANESSGNVASDEDEQQ